MKSLRHTLFALCCVAEMEAASSAAPWRLSVSAQASASSSAAKTAKLDQPTKDTKALHCNALCTFLSFMPFVSLVVIFLQSSERKPSSAAPDSATPLAKCAEYALLYPGLVAFLAVTCHDVHDLLGAR